MVAKYWPLAGWEDSVLTTKPRCLRTIQIVMSGSNSDGFIRIVSQYSSRQ